MSAEHWKCQNSVPITQDPQASLYSTHYHSSLLKHKASLTKGNPCNLFCWHLHIISPLRRDRKCSSWQLQQGWCFKALKPKANNFSHWRSEKIPPIQCLCPSIIINLNADNNIIKHCECAVIKHCKWQLTGAVRFKDALDLSVIAERHCHRVTPSHKLVPDTAASAVQWKFLPSPNNW